MRLVMALIALVIQLALSNSGLVYCENTGGQLQRNEAQTACCVPARARDLCCHPSPQTLPGYLESDCCHDLTLSLSQLQRPGRLEPLSALALVPHQPRAARPGELHSGALRVCRRHGPAPPSLLLAQLSTTRFRC